MSITKIVAIVLMVVGSLVLAYQGISYKTRERVVDLGPLHVSAEKTHSVPLPPILGALVFLGGVALLFTDKGRSAV